MGWKRRSILTAAWLVLILLILWSACACTGGRTPSGSFRRDRSGKAAPAESIRDIPDYAGEPYAVLNDNIPEFTDADLVSSSYETYSALDSLGRCGVACASIGTDLMPVRERGSIGAVRPSGWHTVKYSFVDGNYLYNRCHLIGYQLTAENANVRNLITGTRYLNAEGMEPFECMVADYIKETGNHVLYRVTPVFEGDNLIASGVHMEAESVEDKGDGILFNIYCYNVQPGVRIDYRTGDSRLDRSPASGTGSAEYRSGRSGNRGTATYILNVNTHRFHNPSCFSVRKIRRKNRRKFTGTREQVMAKGYQPCGRCRP